MRTFLRKAIGMSTFTVLVSAAAAGSALATTWNVPGDMSGTCTIAVPSCDTIQDAITASVANDDIVIAAGTYPESNLIIDKTLTITGAGTGSTIIDAGAALGVLPKADGIVIQDLTIQNGSDGMRFELVAGTIDDTLLSNVEITGNSSDGIELSSSTTITNLALDGCTLSSNNNGLRMASASTVNGVTVTGTTFSGNASVGLYQANDGATSTLANLSVTGSTFQNNAFTGLYAEEIRDSTIEGNTFTGNGRGILIFKGFATSGANVGNLAIRDNDFTDSLNTSIQLVIQASGADAPIDVDANTIDQDVGVLLANFGAIDIRLGNAFTHSPINVTDNSVVLSGTFVTATAAHGMTIRGNGPVVATGNLFDGGGVGSVSTAPPSSGIYLRSVDAALAFGTIPATATFDVSCNRITGFENGVSIYDAVGLAYGGLLPGTTVSINDNVIQGNAQAGVVNGATPTIDAENNFWGCAAGPGNVGCDSAVGGVDFNPFSAVPPVCVPCTENANCDDGNLCTQDTCNAGLCEAADEPIDAGSCLGALTAQFQVKMNADPAKNQLKWKWGKGAAFDQSALGDPNIDTTYALCVYDTTAAAPSLETTITVAPGGAWTSKAPKGWRYKDKTGASDGVQGVQLKTGAGGKTKAQVKARGLNLPMPVPFGAEYFDQDPDVIVQLVSSEGVCWNSAFDVTGTTKNEPAQFKAKAQ